jgi:predicted PurR-regulated permease PerM
MKEPNVERTFFIALLIAVTLAFLWLIRGFLQPIFWAIALGILVYPLHARLVPHVRNRESLAAVLSVLLVVIVVVLPLIGIGAAVTREGTALFDRLDQGNLGLQNLYGRAEENMPRVIATLQRFGLDPSRLDTQLSGAAVTAGRAVASRAFAIGQDTLRVTVFFFLMLYLLFFFLRDGRTMLDGLVSALPLGDARERHLLKRFAEVSRATIKGTLVVGIVQGAIGGTAFALLGIGAPVLWGVTMAFLSILPAVGTALVWAPAAIILAFSGRIISAIVLVLIGVFVIGLVDNLLRPLLVGRDTRMPDYLILLSTLGGLAGFGLAGIIIGPIIAAFFLAIWQMAESEFNPASREAAHE